MTDTLERPDVRPQTTSRVAGVLDIQGSGGQGRLRTAGLHASPGDVQVSAAQVNFDTTDPNTMTYYADDANSATIGDNPVFGPRVTRG